MSNVQSLKIDSVKRIQKRLSELPAARESPLVELLGLRGSRKRKSKPYAKESSMSDEENATAVPESPSELKGDKLDARATELGIEGRSDMSADEKRQAVAEAESVYNGVRDPASEKLRTEMGMPPGDESVSGSEDPDSEDPELPPEQQEPTPEDLALVSNLCRANASPGAMRVAHSIDTALDELESQSATEKA